MNETKLKDNVQKTNFIFSKEKIFFQVIIWRTKFIFFWSCWKSLYSVKEHTYMYFVIGIYLFIALNISLIVMRNFECQETSISTTTTYIYVLLHYHFIIDYLDRLKIY